MRVGRDRLRSSALSCVVVALTLSCGPMAAQGGGSPTATATLISAASTAPTRTAVPSTLAVRCSEQRTAADTVRRYFELSTSGDPVAVADCFTARWRTQVGDDGVRRWSTAGPVLSLEVEFADRARGCERFSVLAELANGVTAGWSGKKRAFFIVGSDSGKLRVYEVATALASGDQTQTVCA